MRHYRFRGLVLGLDLPRQRVTIAHADIPNHMKAMTMAFAIRDTNMLRGIEVGDSVSGVLAMRGHDVWVDSLVSDGGSGNGR